MSWRVARSLDELLAEINAADPNRNKAADGSIGDEAHSSRASDHNPNPEGVVRARDFTHDPAGGLDCDALAEFLVDLGRRNAHPALGTGAYVIWEGRIASDTEDGQPWDWEPYRGSNPHRKHLHLSVATEAAGYDTTRPWGWEGEDDMSQYAEQLDKIERQGEAAKRRDIAQRKLMKTLAASTLDAVTDVLEVVTGSAEDIDAAKRRITKSKNAILAAIDDLDEGDGN
ncbi:hypothetical protein [Nocardioides sp.]|uniref:hypothetical protein n=1 Tax=Nocardioides sp. TaxID=35761 RepID=UPI003564F4A9